jgi:hypothetical protein
MAAIADDIATVGWSVSAVLGDEIAPPWAYTVGLWLSHQGPELTMYGLPVEHMTVILNSIGDRIARRHLPVFARRPPGARELADDQHVRGIRPVLRLRQATVPAGRLARPEGSLSGRSRLPVQVRGQAADAVDAP